MIAKNFAQWASVVDLDKVLAITNRRSWTFTIILCAVIIFSFSSLPFLNEFIGLQPRIPGITLIVTTLIAWAGSDETLRARLGVKKHLILTFFVTGSFQTLLWSWCIFSTASSAPMMAAFPLLCIAYHCEIFLLSRNYYWALLPAFSAMAIALALSPSSTHSIIVLIGGTLAVSGSYIMGSNALIQSNLKRERNDLKEALDASTLMDSVNETERTKDLLYEMMGANHDAGNAMTGLLMNLDLLTSAIESNDGSNELDIKEINQETLVSLNKLKQIIEKARNVGKEVHLRELVNTRELLESLIDDFRKQFSNITFTLKLKNFNRANFIKLHGGETSLQRIVTNLVKNSVEGNGLKGASNIEVTAGAAANNLEIVVSDNGPGFNEAQLNKSLSIMKSSKDQGSGLGLYTCKRLVAANKGELDIANKPNGGAQVTVSLPMTD